MSRPPRSDPRHRANGGVDGGSGTAPNITIVNAIAAGDFVLKGLDSGVDGKAQMKFIWANSGAVKQTIDDSNVRCRVTGQRTGQPPQ